MTVCPFCDGQTFVGSEKCDVCNTPVMILCDNKRCGQPQFFENAQCTVCGKPIKTGKKQIETMRKGALL